MSADNKPPEDQFDFYGRGYVAGIKTGSDLTYAQCAVEIEGLQAKLDAAYAEDKPDAIAESYKQGYVDGALHERATTFPSWSDNYHPTVPRHGEDEAVS